MTLIARSKTSWSQGIRAALVAVAGGAYLAIAGPAFGVEPDEILDDPQLEARAREVSQVLRCVVCKSQSIDDSNAPLAKDLRLLVRERITAGDSNEEVVDYVVARYGDYVLLKPQMKSKTMFLWLGPALILIGAGAFGVRYLATARASADGAANTPGEGASSTPNLTADEEDALKEILKK